MIKLVGFNAAFGNFVPEGSTNGESIAWSNRVLRCVTDENLLDGDFGFAIVEQKFKKSEVCRSLGLDRNASEDAVNQALYKLLNTKIEFVAGRVGKEVKINGFKVVQP